MEAAGSLPHASATASVVWAWISWARATGSQARATLIASRARRCASEKMPSSILSWARPASTVARSGLGSRGTSSTARRAASIAPAGSPAARRTWARRSWSSPRRTRSRRASSPPIADSRKAVAREMRPTAKAASDARTWSSTRSDVGALRRRERPPAGDVGQREGRLQRGQLVGRGVARPGEGRRLDRRRPARVAGHRRSASARPPPRAGRRGWPRAPRGGASGRPAAGRARPPSRSSGGGTRSRRRSRRRTRWPAPRTGRPTGRRRATPLRAAGRSPSAAPAGSCRPRTPRPRRRAGRPTAAARPAPRAGAPAGIRASGSPAGP